MMWFKQWRRKKISSREFPPGWREILERNMPYYRKLSEEDRKELQRHILIFLAEKYVEGCSGLEITDEIRVTIAGYACLLLLHRQTDYFPGLHSIVVHPASFATPVEEHDDIGVVTEDMEDRLGEAWERGPVVLSWADVCDTGDGVNVVLHEFAHVIDRTGGKGDNSPVLQGGQGFRNWARILEKQYERLKKDVEKRRPTLLDEYGATDPSEFFAVATECFYEQPRKMKDEYPQLYRALKEFYQQDPAAL
jgi:Mlc titration factor MtfA (ptsG expression regulator)